CSDRTRDCLAHCFGAVTSQCGSVLYAPLPAVSRPSGQMEQERKAGGALHGSSDRRTAQPPHEIALPVTWHSASASLRWAPAVQELRRDEGLASLPRARAWHPERSTGAQARGQLAA